MKGGARAGAGRPKGSKNVTNVAKIIESKLAEIEAEIGAEQLTPLAYMLKVMNSSDLSVEVRLRAASLAAPFVHGKGQGKKGEKEEKAKAAASGRFAAAPPPLKVVK